LAGIAIRKALVNPGDRELRALEQDVSQLRTALDAATKRIEALEGKEPSGEPAAAHVQPPYPDFELPPEAAGAQPESIPAVEFEPAPQASGPASPPMPPSEPAPAPTQPRWWQWLLGGNTVVRVGVVVLFFGVAFLLKYAYDHTRVPIELRLAAVAAGAMTLLLTGWRLRLRRPGYALALQGGGIGVLYLTVFAALRLYGLVPAGAALVLLMLIAALSAMLAVVQNAQSLAILGAGGGFLAPVLTASGGGSHVMLFSYYAVLNAGILGIAWYRSWRPLNLVGFIFTFGIGVAWGARFYRPDLYASTQPFLVLFFLMYLVIPVLFARREATRLERYLDATLVFGVPLLAFGFQLRLTRGIEYGAAFSALALSAVYIALARFLYLRHRDVLRMLVEAFLALGVVFVTLAVPLALDGRWTAASWALEGAALVWVGVRQKRWLSRAFGLILQVAAGIAFLRAAPAAYGAVPIFNSFYVGCVLLALAGLFCNWYLDRHRDRLQPWDQWAAPAIFVWGLAWWTIGGLLEIEDRVDWARQPDVALLFVCGSAAAFSLLWQRIDWRLARYPALALLPLMALGALVTAFGYTKAHPLADLGWVAWPLAFGVDLWLLRRHDAAPALWLDYLHAGSLWVLAGIGSWELAWAIDQLVVGEAVWPLIAWALVPGTLVLAVTLYGERIPWPVRPRLATYLLQGAAPLAAFLWGWLIYANVASNGDPAPLPYMPVLSPLDLTQIGSVLVVGLWLYRIRQLQLVDAGTEAAALGFAVLGTAAFAAANGMLLRTLHHWAGVPFHLEAMVRSMLVQAALSIFWSVLALCAMFVATRLRLRSLWITGAALMGVVVIKLFLVDLSNIGGVERIVSFIGVGLLMLLIGYLSPVPPRTQGQVQ